jgi:hypothetical protein
MSAFNSRSPEFLAVNSGDFLVVVLDQEISFVGIYGATYPVTGDNQVCL